jgi:hypothetical protein
VLVPRCQIEHDEIASAQERDPPQLRGTPAGCGAAESEQSDPHRDATHKASILLV